MCLIMWRSIRGGVLLVACSLFALGCSAVTTASTAVQQHYEAYRLYEEGRARYRADDYRRAAGYFEQALRTDPTLVEAEAALAWSRFHLGQYREATLHFRQAITQEPKWEGLYNGLGWSRFRVGRYYLAIEAFQQAVALSPGYRDAEVGVAFSLFELGRYEEALPILARLSRDGEGGFLHVQSSDQDDVRSRLAWAYFYVGQYDNAAREFRAGITARPAWYGLYNGLGWTYLRLNQPALARANFQKALELKPDFRDAREGLQF